MSDVWCRAGIWERWVFTMRTEKHYKWNKGDTKTFLRLAFFGVLSSVKYHTHTHTYTSAITLSGLLRPLLCVVQGLPQGEHTQGVLDSELCSRQWIGCLWSQKKSVGWKRCEKEKDEGKWHSYWFPHYVCTSVTHVTAWMSMTSKWLHCSRTWNTHYMKESAGCHFLLLSKSLFHHASFHLQFLSFRWQCCVKRSVPQYLTFWKLFISLYHGQPKCTSLSKLAVTVGTIIY